MALKDTWRPRVDGVDNADSSAVNEIAKAVIEIEENIEENGASTGGSIVIDDEMSDTSENAVQNKIIKKYVDDMVGNIEIALSEVESIADELIGGVE